MRGSNGQVKWDCIRDKISESAASIAYFQETKKEMCHIFTNFVPNM